MADTDPQTLFAQAKCYLCLGITMAEALQLALLADIANGGGSGASTNITSGVGPPVAAPSTSPAIYFDENTGAQYNYYGGAWH